MKKNKVLAFIFCIVIIMTQCVAVIAAPGEKHDEYSAMEYCAHSNWKKVISSIAYESVSNVQHKKIFNYQRVCTLCGYVDYSNIPASSFVLENHVLEVDYTKDNCHIEPGQHRWYKTCTLCWSTYPTIIMCNGSPCRAPD